MQAAACTHDRFIHPHLPAPPQECHPTPCLKTHLGGASSPSQSRYPPPPLSFPTPCPSPGRGWGIVTCSTQIFLLQLTVLLWQNHHPRVLPKAFQWKVVSMRKSSKSSGAGPRKFTPSWSRRRSPYIGSPLNVSYAELFRFMLQFLYLQMCVYGGGAVPQGGGGGDRQLVTVPQGVVGDRLPWGGKGQGEGGVHALHSYIACHLWVAPPPPLCHSSPPNLSSTPASTSVPDHRQTVWFSPAGHASSFSPSHAQAAREARASQAAVPTHLPAT